MLPQGFDLHWMLTDDCAIPVFEQLVPVDLDPRHNEP
jgi:hypothetical protein